MKNSNDRIGNRTRDLPTCSAVPQVYLECRYYRGYQLISKSKVMQKKGVWGDAIIPLVIHNLCIRANVGGEIQVQLCDPLGTSPWYLLSRRLGGSRSRFERFGHQKYMSPYRTMGAGHFPGVKRPERRAVHPPPSKCRGHERVGLYLYSPSGHSWPVIGRTFTFTYVTLPGIKPRFLGSRVSRLVSTSAI